MEPGKREDEEEEEAFLTQSLDDDEPSSSSESQKRGGSRRRVVTAYLRVILEIAMAATIVYLLVAKPFVVQRETIRKTPVPRRTLRDDSTALGRWLIQLRLKYHGRCTPSRTTPAMSAATCGLTRHLLFTLSITGLS